jgi:hypothetical protein
MIAVAFLARTALDNPGNYFAPQGTLLIIALTVVAGFAGMVKVFLPFFREWDPMYFFVPSALYYLHRLLAGFILGFMLAYLRALWRRHLEK